MRLELCCTIPFSLVSLALARIKCVPDDHPRSGPLSRLPRNSISLAQGGKIRTLARLRGSYPASARLFSVAFPNYTNESCRETDRQHERVWRPMLLFEPAPTPCG